MKLKIIDSNKIEKGTLDMPIQFVEKIRTDLIKKAVLVLFSRKRQPYGSFKDAGKRHSAYVSKRRRAFKGTYGIGQSRTPRKVMSANGTRMNWVGAFAPQTVGGRKAHPPKSDKKWELKINKKENRFAIRSAMSATLIPEIVKKRGHLIPDNYPFIIDSDVEKLSKTKDIHNLLVKLGFEKELNRASKKTIRSGKGKTRGRKYRKKKSLLIVVSNDCPLLKASQNIAGIDVAKVNSLNADLLAPGTYPGRATLWTKSSIEKIQKENLYM